MRSISRFTVLAALLGAGLPAYANPPAPDSAPVPFYAAPAPMTPVMPSQNGVVDTPRASVAAIMQQAGQALLWDGTRGEYVVVRAGDSFHEFRVSVVSAEQVVLSRGNQHFILPRTSDTSNLATRGQAGAAVTVPLQADVVDPYAAGGSVARPAPGFAAGALPPIAASSPGSAPVMGMAPVDPYGSAARPPVLFSPDELPPAGGPAVLDPYAPSAAPAGPPAPSAPSLPSSLLESRVKSMPRKSAEPSASRSAEPSASRSAEPSASRSAEPSASVAASDTPRVTSMPRSVVQSQSEAGSLRDEQHSLSRREFDATISDFHALGRDVQVTQVADGVRVDEVAPSSLPYRMGVRPGDVVLDVDGKKIRNMNDAAAIYARLMDADQFAVKVKRGAGIVTLRYRFTR
jgi:hypothetical protein